MIVAQEQDTRRRFLDRFPGCMRPLIANSFIDATRAGAVTVAEVERRVERIWLCRLDTGERVRDGLTRRRAQVILDKLAAHPDEATALSEWALEWSRLPAAKRAKRKRDLDADPPTPRQVAYAALLGYDGPIRSRREATQIIDVLKAGKVA